MTHLRSRYAQEAYRHEHASDCDLIVAVFYAIEILNTERIRRDKTVQRENFVHLYGSN